MGIKEGETQSRFGQNDCDQNHTPEKSSFLSRPTATGFWRPGKIGSAWGGGCYGSVIAADRHCRTMMFLDLSGGGGARAGESGWDPGPSANGGPARMQIHATQVGLPSAPRAPPAQIRPKFQRPKGERPDQLYLPVNDPPIAICSFYPPI